MKRGEVDEVIVTGLFDKLRCFFPNNIFDESWFEGAKEVVFRVQMVDYEAVRTRLLTMYRWMPCSRY
jgi:hypothetical protein